MMAMSLSMKMVFQIDILDGFKSLVRMPAANVRDGDQRLKQNGSRHAEVQLRVLQNPRGQTELRVRKQWRR